MNHSIINREFRDYSAESMYPFSDTALLTNDQGIVIQPEVFLDALIYSMDDVTQPFYISDLRGTIGEPTQMGVVIKDDNNKEVCTGVIDIGTDSSVDTCYLYDTLDRANGTLVYQPDHMSQLIGRVGILDYEFSKTQTPFLAERGFVTRTSGLSVISAAGNTFSNEVYIVGANGVHFTEEDGEIYIHLLGEESLTTRPVKTINGLELKHLWLAAHPNSAIKVETLGDSLKIWKINDAQ